MTLVCEEATQSRCPLSVTLVTMTAAVVVSQLLSTSLAEVERSFAEITGEREKERTFQAGCVIEILTRHQLDL